MTSQKFQVLEEVTRPAATPQVTGSVYGHFDHCQNCGKAPLTEVLNFGFHPPCDALLKASQLTSRESFYPLMFCRCTHCGLVQINYAVDPKELFYEEYPYTTGITTALKQNFHEMAAHLVSTLKIPRGSLVVDIGSNDGTILSGFKMQGMQVWGVEPTGVAQIANDNGIPTTQAFFNGDIAAQIRQDNGPATLVTAANVFAHVANLAPAIRGIHHLLADDGTFVSESHYLLPLIETLQYDTIYHEHLRFYSLKPMIDMMNRYGFQVVDAERIPNHGGSIRVYAKKNGGAQSERLKALIRDEERAGLYDAVTYDKFRERVQRSKWKLMEILSSLKLKGNRIVGLGSPGRSSTIMNYCGIGADTLDYLAEQTGSLKIGRYSPGTHVQVVDEARMLKEQPEYALVLAWHLGDPILKKLRAKGLRSKYIMPLPDPVILDW